MDLRLDYDELIILVGWIRSIERNLFRELTPAEMQQVVNAWLGQSKVEIQGITYFCPKRHRGLKEHYKEMGIDSPPA